jgi:hypothetical protein
MIDGRFENFAGEEAFKLYPTMLPLPEATVDAGLEHTNGGGLEKVIISPTVDGGGHPILVIIPGHHDDWQVSLLAPDSLNQFMATQVRQLDINKTDVKHDFLKQLQRCRRAVTADGSQSKLVTFSFQISTSVEVVIHNQHPGSRWCLRCARNIRDLR